MTWQELAFWLGLGSAQAARQRYERLARRTGPDHVPADPQRDHEEPLRRRPGQPERSGRVRHHRPQDFGDPCLHRVLVGQGQHGVVPRPVHSPVREHVQRLQHPDHVREPRQYMLRLIRVEVGLDPVQPADRLGRRQFRLVSVSAMPCASLESSISANT